MTDFSSPPEKNLKREIYFSSFMEEQSDLDDDLHFYLNTVFATTKTTNRENYSKVVINVLNCLNFWFNFCVFDIHLYIQRFFGLFLKLYEYLIVLKSKLNVYLQSFTNRI